MALNTEARRVHELARHLAERRRTTLASAVDTSALVAALSGGSESHRVTVALAASAASIMSAANYLECSIVLASRCGDDGVHDLRLYLPEAGVGIVPVDRDQADLALDAWMRYGKGRHPAALHDGGCFAYALASLRRTRLLFVGEDFARTDVAAAERTRGAGREHPHPRPSMRTCAPSSFDHQCP